MGNVIGGNAFAAGNQRAGRTADQPAPAAGTDAGSSTALTQRTHPDLRARHRGEAAAGVDAPAPAARGRREAPRRAPLLSRTAARAAALGSVAGYAYMLKQLLIAPSVVGDLHGLPTRITSEAHPENAACYPECLGGLVFKGEPNAEAVTQMAQDTLHHFREEILTEDERSKTSDAVRVVPLGPMTAVRTGRLGFVPTNEQDIPRRIFAQTVEIAHPNLVFQTRSDDTYKSVLYHEMVHAHSANEFYQGVKGFANAIAGKNLGQSAKLVSVVVESLTLGLQHKVAPERDMGAYNLHTTLARTPLGFPSSMERLGAHVIDHLGVDTVRDAMIGGDKAAIDKVLGYFQELQNAPTAKRI
jgi:hypothetical protein